MPRFMTLWSDLIRIRKEHGESSADRTRRSFQFYGELPAATKQL